MVDSLVSMLVERKEDQMAAKMAVNLDRPMVAMWVGKWGRKKAGMKAELKGDKWAGRSDDSLVATLVVDWVDSWVGKLADGMVGPKGVLLAEPKVARRAVCWVVSTAVLTVGLLELGSVDAMVEPTVESWVEMSDGAKVEKLDRC